MSWIAGIWGKIAAGGLVLLGIMAAVLRFASVNKKAGIDAQKAKEAEQRERDIQNIKKAGDAGARVRPDDGGMLDDPYNRDRRGKP